MGIYDYALPWHQMFIYIYIYILNQEKKGRACSFLSFSFCCYPNEYLTRIL